MTERDRDGKSAPTTTTESSDSGDSVESDAMRALLKRSLAHESSSASDGDLASASPIASHASPIASQDTSQDTSPSASAAAAPREREKGGRQDSTILRGVQKKIRQRSKGKFYGDGWSTTQSKVNYALVAVIMLVLIGIVYFVMGPTGISVAPR